MSYTSLSISSLFLSLSHPFSSMHCMNRLLFFVGVASESELELESSLRLKPAAPGGLTPLILSGFGLCGEPSCGFENPRES